VVLLLSAMVLIFVHGPKMLAMIGDGTLLASLVVIVFGLLFGELLRGGRPGYSRRPRLCSCGAASRHPAAAGHWRFPPAASHSDRQSSALISCSHCASNSLDALAQAKGHGSYLSSAFKSSNP